MNNESLNKTMNLLFIVLAVDIAITALVGLNAFITIHALHEIQSGTRTIDQVLINRDEFWGNFAKLTILSTVGVGFALVIWQNACYSYAKKSIGAVDFKNEKWTAAGWIIPFLNLFKPYQIISEIYKAGALWYVNADDWKKENGSWLLLMWWIFWLMTHLIMLTAANAMIAKSNLDNLAIPQLIGIYDIRLWICIISISVSVTWFVIANFLTQRLFERNTVRFSYIDNQSGTEVDNLDALKKPILTRISGEDALTGIVLFIILSFGFGIATTYHEFDAIHRTLAVKNFDYSSLGNFEFMWQFFTTPKVWGIALVKGTLCAFAGALIALLMKLIFKNSSELWVWSWIITAYLVFTQIN